MLTIVADEFGKLDLLYAPCSIEMYRIQYGVSGYHANCYDNLCAAFRELRVEPEPLPSSLNFFMNADVGADGRSTFSPPRTRAGASITSRGNGSRDRTIFAPCVNLHAAPIRPLAFEILGV